MQRNLHRDIKQILIKTIIRAKSGQEIYGRSNHRKANEETETHGQVDDPEIGSPTDREKRVQLQRQIRLKRHRKTSR